jgi:lipopolysaccharide/colanic/teichoic acid biosynthesis glycosyltransferase
MKQSTKHSIQIFFLIVPSVLFLYMSLWLTVLLWYPEGLSVVEATSHITLFTIIFSVWLISFFAFGLFDPWRHKHIRDFVGGFLNASALNLLFAVLVFYVQPDLVLTPRRFLIVQFGIASCLLFVWLFSLRHVLYRHAVTHVYFVNLSEQWDEMKSIQGLRRNHSLHLKQNVQFNEHGEHCFSQKVCERSWFVVDQVSHMPTHVMEKLQGLHAKGATIVSFPEFYEDYLRRVSLDDLNDWWFLVRSRKGVYDSAKRFLDILSGLIIGVFFVVSFPFIAFLIKLSGKGPVFFRQERYSLQGKAFKLIKYRSMRTGTRTDTWTEENDPRITRIGSFLRKSRLDEIPQCINLLKGEMSLVGPRPEQSHLCEQLADRIPFYNHRTEILPGLAGWAQLHVYASDVEDSRRKLQYDLYYLKHRSFMFDLEIIVKTILHVLHLSGR